MYKKLNISDTFLLGFSFPCILIYRELTTVHTSVRNEPDLKHYELKLALFVSELKLTLKKNNGPEPN